jgi:hypothetical protein
MNLARGDNRKDCCKVEENLGPVVQERVDLAYRRCSVCQCRHFELTADPLVINLRGAAIG